MPQISVIVPTFNRVGRLRQVIEALEQQQYPRDDYEVIVVSDGSTDGTNSYLESLHSPMQLRWLLQPNRGPAAARNAGVDQAIGDLIVFVDDDVVPQPSLLAEHMRAHCEAGREVVVLGPLLSPEGFRMTPWVRWEQDMLMKQYKAIMRGDWEPSARQFYTGNTSLRRKHILTAGGFDESFRRAEDVELAYRLAIQGLDFVFTMRPAGMHFAERSFRSWLDIAYAYGRNDVVFGRDRRQPWIFEVAHREFDQRNVLVRRLVRVCIGRPRKTTLAAHGLKFVADAATWIGADRVEKSAYSGLFNMRYYQGFCDELGNPHFFSA
jgi:glycosyltransferase involved in cell wall biosynthesis